MKHAFRRLPALICARIRARAPARTLRLAAATVIAGGTIVLLSTHMAGAHMGAPHITGTHSAGLHDLPQPGAPNTTPFGLSAEALFYLALTALALMFLELVLPTLGLLGIAGFAGFVWACYQLYLVNALPGALVILGAAGALTLLVAGLLTWKSYRRKVTTGVESLIGSTGKIVEWQNDKGRVAVQGEIWQAEAETVLSLRAGEPVKIIAVENLTLRIAPFDPV